MQSVLDEIRDQSPFTDLDWHLAQFLTRYTPLSGIQKNRFLFLILHLSAQQRTGHVCIMLSQLEKTFFMSSGPMEIFWDFLGKPNYSDWREVLEGSGFVSMRNGRTPLVWDDDRLYFQRNWQNEQTVARFFATAAKQTPSDSLEVTSILDTLFKRDASSYIDWQKIAVAMALTRAVTIISGGPGTGKTTTVAKLLAAHLMMLSQESPTLRVKVTAPTGKAAARLTGSLRAAMLPLQECLPSDITLPTEAITLHRLLGASSHRRPFLYHKNNPLHLDILIIDEASMVDLSMMATVIEALPSHAKLILLGDHEQLSSVEAGAILGDLCGFSKAKYSPERAKELNSLTGMPLPFDRDTPPIADIICLLQKSHRFDEHSGIGLLAKYIKEGQSQDALCLVNSTQFKDVKWYDFEEMDYEKVIEHIGAQYTVYLKILRETRNLKLALDAWDEFRLLTPIREGKYGVDGLNRAIERHLIKLGEVQITQGDGMYIGRPVMILKNHPKLKLWNGDIGITWYAEGDPEKKQVYFHLTDGTLRGFSPALLPEHETAFAMTVHKAQGSEFSHAAFILPESHIPLLTRSLLYTAVTRAKQKMTLYGSKKILQQTILSQVERRTGLQAMLSLNGRTELTEMPVDISVKQH